MVPDHRGCLPMSPRRHIVHGSCLDVGVFSDDFQGRPRVSLGVPADAIARVGSNLGASAPRESRPESHNPSSWNLTVASQPQRVGLGVRSCPGMAAHGLQSLSP